MKKEEKEKKKNPHEKHRERMRSTVLADPTFKTMTEIQVLEFFLGFFTPRKDTNVIAHDLLDKFDTLHGVCSATYEELFKVTGVTKNSAFFLSHLFAFLTRVKTSKNSKIMKKLDKPEDFVEYLSPMFENISTEAFYALFLDLNDKLISADCISRGIANVTNVEINDIVMRVTRKNALKVVIAHNHPAGNKFPSDDDVNTTTVIGSTLASLGVKLIDHIIFAGDKEYFSFFENNLMDKVYTSFVPYAQKTAEKFSAKQFAGKYVFENRKNDENDDENDDK